ncbi:MAG TPA: ribonuclease H-like domain-containing protein, partial [Anaerolineaceae bacterium]|nr:ribonuclease H-like domain-containing protein [Anaerolineaceae bacterium]
MTDWGDLTEKLKRLGVKLGSERLPTPALKPKYPIDKVVQGRFLETPLGAVFSSDHYYPANHQQGRSKIRPEREISRLAQWAKLERFDPADYDSFVFIDTETTGLSGGTGTMAFMVGAARFVAGNLVLEQFFLQNPAEERALLTGLSSFLGEMKAVVSYNGKAFDLPILNTRFVLNGMNNPFEGLAHFDLLPITRRVWKARLDQCNLGNIEHHILGLDRDTDEVPGYLVPEIYMDYLHSGDATPLEGIFKHNENDVVSLAALFSTINDLLEDPFGQSEAYASDHVSIGRLMGSLGDEEMAIRLYESSNALGGDRVAQTASLLRLAEIYKRRGDWKSALPLWEEAASSNALIALVELAKYYEHQE